MDEKRTERISRALDDDLSRAEREEFEGWLADDAEVAAEFETMRQLQRAVARVADEMEPPAALDAVMKPMLVGTPTTPRRVRPAFRWLGAAAAVVLGVTVAFEVARRNPTPSLSPGSKPRVINQDEREIFKLAPLPTAVPDPNRPLGATDHLLMEEPEHPPAPEPRALEIIGPLTDEEHIEVAESASGSPLTDGADESLSSPTATEGPAENHGTEKRRALDATTAAVAREQRAPSISGSSRGDEAAEKSQVAAAGKRFSDKDGALAQAKATPAAVIMGGVVIWTGRCSPCGASKWEVVFTVEDGVVTAVEHASGDPKSSPDDACLLHDFVGILLDEIADGRHLADVVPQ